MKTRTLKLTAFAFLLALSLPLLFIGGETSSDNNFLDQHSTGLGTVEALDSAYLEWEKQFVAEGGERNITFPMGWSKALATENVPGTATVKLNIIDGIISVESEGLRSNTDYDFWMIDNGRSAILPEEGDSMIRVGSLSKAGSLEASLGAKAFASFDPDLFVITRAGSSPTISRLLVGMTSLYHRLYRSSQNPNQGVLADLELPAPQAKEQGWFDRITESILPTANAQIGPIPNPTTPRELLITAGRQSFFNDTFQGNGRTCGTCHREDNNLTIDPEFIATLPPNDPLFVAEFVPALANNFENPLLMRKVGLILENVDGFDDLANKFVMRGVPHTLALIPNTLAPSAIDGTTNPPSERTGWSGDGAPSGTFTLGNGSIHTATGSLRDFIIGAVIQHYPKTLNRQNGVDFVLPTPAQLDALEAFQKSTGRQADIKLAGSGALSLKNATAARGQAIFLNPGSGLPPFIGNPNIGAGKCLFCHFNAGAGDFVEAVLVGGSSPDPGLATNVNTNANFDTGVEDLPSQPADLLVPLSQNPPDGGFGTAPLVVNGVFVGFGSRSFNTPVLVEAADTGPFFHNNSIETIEGGVAFYNSTAFNNTVTGQAIGGINLEATEVVAVAAFLRVINALENLRSSIDLENRAKNAVSFSQAQELIKLSIAELDDAHEVLDCGGLHPDAQSKLIQAAAIDAVALITSNKPLRNLLIDQALALKRAAVSDLRN